MTAADSRKEKRKSRRIWLTWENQRRNIGLSRAFGASLFQFEHKGNRVARYCVSLFKSLVTLIKERPTLIFVQNPSMVLALFAVSYGRIASVPVVVDAHNAGLVPFGGRKSWANKVAAHTIRKAALTIVTNGNLKKYVERQGGTAFVLTDVIPSFSLKCEKKDLKGKFNVLFICSFAEDEPFGEVFRAAGELDMSISIYVTGNARRVEKGLLNRLPENVVLTGYLPEDQYVQLLHQVDLVIDLTTREDCLVCGGYEALAAEKPLIVSGRRVLREYFSKGALFTDNTSSNLADQIRLAKADIEKLRRQIVELKRKKLEEWNEMAEQFETLLREIESSPERTSIPYA